MVAFETILKGISGVKNANVETKRGALGPPSNL
jgi:hypothetical protein